MTDRLIEYIRENKLIRQGETVCAGISGGADSVCLLLMLDSIKNDLGFKLCAFHVDHNLRGDESAGDRAFTEDLCAQKGIPLKVFSYDVKKLSNEWKKGTEETGRICRKQAALEMLSSGCDKIAFAHHKNDLAETFLFNLSRGSSLNGLSGIRASSGRIIHPMLCFTRLEIENYLESGSVPWCTDSTNSDREYTRNRLRWDAVPVLESVNSKAVEHISICASDIAQADDILNSLADEKIKEYVRFEENGFFIGSDINKEPKLLRTYILRSAIKLAGGSLTDLSRIHMESVLDLFEKPSGRKVSLPFGITAIRNYDILYVRISEQEKKDGSQINEIPLKPESTFELSDIKIMTGCISINSGDEVFSDLQYTKTLDYDKIKNACFRNPLKGDYIVTCSGGGKKKLSGYFKDIKLPSLKRKNTVVLADGSEVFWVVGYRISESAKVTAETINMITLEVELL